MSDKLVFEWADSIKPETEPTPMTHLECANVILDLLVYCPTFIHGQHAQTYVDRAVATIMQLKKEGGDA